jgi:hypothetical protein
LKSSAISSGKHPLQRALESLDTARDLEHASGESGPTSVSPANLSPDRYHGVIGAFARRIVESLTFELRDLIYGDGEAQDIIYAILQAFALSLEWEDWSIGLHLEVQASKFFHEQNQ